MDVILANKEWPFSGIGVTLMLALVALVRHLLGKQRARQPGAPQLGDPASARVSVTGSPINAGGDVVIVGGNQILTEQRARTDKRA